MIKIFAVVVFLLSNPDTGELEQKMYRAEMNSMEECRAFVHQEQFTQNMLKAIPGTENALGMIYTCLETIDGQEI